MSSSNEDLDLIMNCSILFYLRNTFISICIYGNLQKFIAFYLLFPKIIMRDIVLLEEGFIKACECGHIDIVKQIIKFNNNINISANNDQALRLACSNGYIEIVKYLKEIKPSIDISANEDEAFINACIYGHLDIAKLLIEYKPNINISARDNEAFYLACTNGHIHIIKYIKEIKPDFDITFDDNISFTSACDEGHLHIIRQLYEWNSNINLNESFKFACTNLKYNIIKQLVDWDQNIIKNNQNILTTNIKIFLLSLGYSNFDNYENILISCENEIEKKDCVICLSSINDKYIKTDCDHIYCRECIIQWLFVSEICPYCRRKI